MARSKEFDKATALEKAMEIFWANGYNATSMQDLVDGLGISRSSMYDTFGDKEALFYAALEVYYTKHQAGTISSLLVTTTPTKTLKDIFADVITQSLADIKQRGCFMVNTTIELAACSPKANEVVSKNSAEMEMALTKAMEKGQQMGEIQTRSTAGQLAKFVANAWVGMRVSARMGHDRQSLYDITTVTLNFLKA